LSGSKSLALSAARAVAIAGEAARASGIESGLSGRLGTVEADFGLVEAMAVESALTTRFRPGQSPTLFTRSLAGGDPEALAPLSESFVTVGSFGPVAETRPAA
jgi:hypothetical protein